MGARRRGRELAFQVLFQTDQTGDRVNAVIARFQDFKHAGPEVAAFAEELAVGAHAGQAELDALVSAAADHWKLDRLLSVDRALLRLGAYELSRCPDVPMEVILDEYIALAKIYGGDDSSAFVNGVLDRLAGGLRSAESGSGAAAKARGKAAPGKR